MSNQLIFKSHTLETIKHKNQIWLTSGELATALGYSSSKSISNLYAQNADEFSHGMSEVVETTTSKKSTSYSNLV